MVKTPRTRHSASKKEPVTIDLEAVRSDTEPGDEAKSAEADPVTHPHETEEAQADAAHDAPDESTGGGSDQPPPEAKPVPSMRYGNGAIPGGLVGGVVALLLAGGLQYAGVFPALNSAQQPDTGLATLRQEIADMQGQIAELRATPQEESSAALEEALAEPRQQIVQLREMVQSLEQQVATDVSPDQSEALASLEQRRSELETSFAELSRRLSETNSTDGELARRLDAAETELAGLRETAQSADDVSAVVARVDEIAGKVEALSAEVARQDEGPKVALVVAASSLKSAVERGAPFASELETYSSLAANAADFDRLRPYAERGIPTLAALSEQASALASRIAAAENAPDASAGFMDRLMTSARSVVTVRPVGEVAGEAASAIAARMEAAVQRGDLEAAVTQYESLPPAMKELGADFAEKLRARQAAGDILDQALSNALKPA